MLTLSGLAAILWRRKWLVLLCFAVFFALAAAMILRLKPRYASEAMLMVDPRQTHITNIQAVQDGPAGLSDLNYLRSEMQILGSDQLARQVVEALQLQDSPEFAAQSGLWGTWVTPMLLRFGLATPPEPLSAEARMAATVSTYQARFSSFNDARSFIIATSFTGPTPANAQQILAKHVSLYLENQRAAKRQVVRKAEAWFELELERLHAMLMEAEKSQHAFQQANRLLRTGGETLAARQMMDVSAQLAEARADLGRKADRVQQLAALARQPFAAASADTTALSSDVIQRLREQESTASQRIAQLQSRYASGYQELISARAALVDVQGRIAAEFVRVGNSAQADAAIARANTQRLEASLAVLERQLGQTADAELTSRQFARDSDADQRLYSDLLARSKQVAVQLETQEADARLVSSPSLSMRPVSPRYGVLGVIALTGAGLAAAALTIMRDLMSSKRFMSLADVEAGSGLPGLAMLPLIKRAWWQTRNPLASRTHLAASIQTLRNSVAFRMPPGDAKVVVFASALAGDGKTLTSALFSRSMTAGGARVLLIDADLRRSGLSRLLQLPTEAGLTELLQRQRPFADCIRRDAALGVDVLPAGQGPGDIEAILNVENVRRVIDDLRSRYDVIVVDTPPIAAVDDALPFAFLADATVLVIRWGSTPQHVVQGALGRLRLAAAQVVGGVLNAADPPKYRENDLEAYRLSSSYFLKAK